MSFGYQPGSAVLRGINLIARPGETIALVGPSGSGKTTLATLLQRFYSVTDGAITIDGVDIRHMTQHSLRNQIGVVFQDAHLFNDTVRANIAYGRPQATEAEIEAAAKAAHAHDFIMSLPEGYDTDCARAGDPALRWAASAHRHCPGAAEESADPDSGRGHLRARQRVRAPDTTARSRRCCRDAPHSSSPTGSPPCAMPIGSW